MNAPLNPQRRLPQAARIVTLGVGFSPDASLPNHHENSPCNAHSNPDRPVTQRPGTPSSRAMDVYRQNEVDPAEARVKTFAPLVKRLAYHLVSRLPASVEVDDLIQAGLIGLMEAARNFDTEAGVMFETYATQRIRGAMLDELREADWLPRHIRKSVREMEKAMSKLEHSLGRAPNELEMAAAMNLPLADYQSMLGDCRGHQLIYYDETDTDDDSHHALDSMAADILANPYNEIAEGAFRRHLIAAIESLPEREKLVMALYYDEELNLKEIGAVLGVSESRVCQLHSQSVVRLRAKLKAWA
jgi:RNA polymerase sigma factor FliA